MGELTHDYHACPGCGHEVPPNSIVCPRCGEALTDAANMLAPLHAIRRKLFIASGVLFVLALTAFLLGGTGSDWPIIASIGLVLMASVVLALALAV
jgi:uncharacterized paraquat-inducible protein A